MSDFSSYFQSINTDILFKELSRYIVDEDVLNLIRSFSPNKYGLSLGNEISQIPASWFPSKIDHYFKDRLGRSYFRYMDDILFITSKDNVDQDISSLIALSKELDLVLKEEKIRIFNIGEQLKWCKENFYFNNKEHRYYKMLNTKRIINEKRKLKVMKRKLDGGTIDKRHIDMQCKTVYNSLANHGNSFKLCCELK